MEDLLWEREDALLGNATPFVKTPLPTNARIEDGSKTKRRPAPTTRARSPRRVKKKPPPRKGDAERNLSLPITELELERRNIPTPEHPAMFRNRRVAKALAEAGVRMMQLRTIRQSDHTLVVQRRGCRLIKRVSDDNRLRLLRDDDTIVETMHCGQIQRMVTNAKTPTLERALVYVAASPPDPTIKSHKWQELHHKVSATDCFTVICA